MNQHATNSITSSPRSLSDIAVGEQVSVTALTTQGGMRRRLLDLGLTQHTQIECLGRSPGGDPSAYLIRGAVIAIRKADSKTILVTAPGR